MNIIIAHSDSEVASIAALAGKIWREHFTPIIGQAQVEYMLEKFQSPLSIRKQIDSNFIYLLAQQDGRSIGYAGLVPDSKNSSIQLSKFYLLKSVRGQGLGRELMYYIEALCQNRQINRIWLTVNRHNADPIAAYEKMGFVKTDEVIQDIGASFVMDDFIMEKRLSSPA